MLEDKDFERLITLGVDGYFRKPIDQKLLKTIVGMTLTKATKLGRKHSRMFLKDAVFEFKPEVLDNLIIKIKNMNSLYEEFNKVRDTEL